MLAAFIGLASCENDYPMYDEPDNRLNFVYETTAAGTVVHRTINFTFAYTPSEIIQDTVWVEVQTMGFLSDVDRRFALQQVKTGSGDAEAGKHYIDFENAELAAKWYYIPAGQTKRRVPVVILRDDTMEEREFKLLVEIKENDNFKTGYPNYSQIELNVSDILTQPKNWPSTGFSLAAYYFAGDYGKVKHRFMVDVGTPVGLIPNDEHMFAEYASYDVDMSLAGYYYSFFASEVLKENARREALGLGKMKEEDGTLVRFALYGTPQPLE